MAVSVVVNQTCDRCQKPFVEKVLKQGESMPALHRQAEPLIIMRGEKVIARFDDLCPDCEHALVSIVGRVRLDPAAQPKKKKAPAAAQPTPPAPQTATTGNAPGVAAVVVSHPTETGPTGNVTVTVTEGGEATVVKPAAPAAPAQVDEDLF
jgi:hypothetical protein